MSLIWTVIGISLKWLMCFIFQVINNSPGKVSMAANVFYLLFGRILYGIGFTMFLFPILSRASITRPFYLILSHSIWVPLARLSYGAYLAHGIFMQFRMYNTEKGYWASGFDSFLFFLAFMLFSFAISFLTYIFVEMPCAQIWKDLTSKDSTD